MGWPWIALLIAAVALVVAAEGRRSGVAGTRRRRSRRDHRSALHVVPAPDDDFVRSVQRDLDALPLLEEPRSGRP